MKKNYLKIIIFVLLFVLFSIISYCVVSGKIFNFDQRIYSFIISFKNDNITNFFKFITKFCNTFTIVCLCFISLFLILIKYHGSIYLNINIIISTFLNLAIKEIFKIERPNILQMINETTYSFPSGHAMASVSFYGFIIFLVVNSKLSKHWKFFISLGLFLIIIMVGVSRIYLGVHNASDIIGGYLVSSMLLIVSTSMVLKYRKCDL